MGKNGLIEEAKKNYEVIKKLTDSASAFTVPYGTVMEQLQMLKKMSSKPNLLPKVVKDNEEADKHQANAFYRGDTHKITYSDESEPTTDYSQVANYIPLWPGQPIKKTIFAHEMVHPLQGSISDRVNRERDTLYMLNDVMNRYAIDPGEDYNYGEKHGGYSENEANQVGAGYDYIMAHPEQYEYWKKYQANGGKGSVLLRLAEMKQQEALPAIVNEVLDRTRSVAAAYLDDPRRHDKPYIDNHEPERAFAAGKIHYKNEFADDDLKNVGDAAFEDESVIAKLAASNRITPLEAIKRIKAIREKKKKRGK